MSKIVLFLLFCTAQFAADSQPAGTLIQVGTAQRPGQPMPQPRPGGDPEIISKSTLAGVSGVKNLAIIVSAPRGGATLELLRLKLNDGKTTVFTAESALKSPRPLNVGKVYVFALDDKSAASAEKIYSQVNRLEITRSGKGNVSVSAVDRQTLKITR